MKHLKLQNEKHLKKPIGRINNVFLDLHWQIFLAVTGPTQTFNSLCAEA